MPDTAQSVRDPVQLIITRLGAQGDGVAEGSGVASGAPGPVFVPYALAGETVRAVREGERARLVAVVTASPDRVAPVCRHFTRCGGCALQHLAPEPYAAWKTAQVESAFRGRGLDVAPALRPLVGVGLGARRRVTLAARRALDGGVILGFHAAGTHDIVDLAECPVTSPRIVAAFDGLRRLVEPLLPRREAARVAVTLCRNGLDVDIGGISRELSAERRAGLAREAAAVGLVRLSVEGDAVVTMAAPVVACGGVDVTPAPGAFLQAAQAAETRMAELIVANLPRKARRVADLFCGVGAFSFALARTVVVAAYDGDGEAVSALRHATRHTQGLKPIEAKARDLFREPLSRKELEAFDAVVLDPPRAGAMAQAEALAKSKVGTVLAVSCNPATLARDVRILVDGGYKLESVTPIDQFVYSPHIEAVAVLRR